VNSGIEELRDSEIEGLRNSGIEVLRESNLLKNIVVLFIARRLSKCKY
jgi:hypothetical protein